MMGDLKDKLHKSVISGNMKRTVMSVIPAMNTRSSNLINHVITLHSNEIRYKRKILIAPSLLSLVIQWKDNMHKLMRDVINKRFLNDSANLGIIRCNNMLNSIRSPIPNSLLQIINLYKNEPLNKLVGQLGLNLIHILQLFNAIVFQKIVTE